MTETTDIAALREHNQHIVAHLTRSNPRRPLSSAEVLTLESAKLVVAALSVRDGLPDADHSEYWFEHEGKLLFDGALFNSRVEIFIESKLEAERQRADDAESKLRSEVMKSLLTTDCMRKAHRKIAEMESEQVPVVWKVTTPSGSIVFHTEEQDMDGHSYYGNTVTPLFTAPQNPVVLLPPAYEKSADFTEYHQGWNACRNYMLAEAKEVGGIVKDGE